MSLTVITTGNIRTCRIDDNLYDRIDNLEDAIATLSEKWKVPMMNKFR